MDSLSRGLMVTPGPGMLVKAMILSVALMQSQGSVLMFVASCYHRGPYRCQEFGSDVFQTQTEDKGHVWVHGPTAALVYDNVHDPCWHQTTHGVPGSGLLPEAMLVLEG